MKPLLALFSALIFVQCSPAPVVEIEEVPTEPAPKLAATSSGTLLHFDEDALTLSAAASDEQVTATFVATNRTLTPITINKLESSCSCISVEADQMQIAPGEQSTITAVFEIAKLVGNSHKTITVRTDSADHPEQFLKVNVNVPSILEISPKMVAWHLGDPVEPKAITFRVLRDKPIHITEIKPSTQNAVVELNIIEEGRHYEILVTPNTTDQSRTGMIRIQTDCELEKHRRQMAFFSVNPSTDDAEP